MTALPTASTPGYVTFRGRVTCTCMAEWLPVFELLAQLRGLIRGPLPIIQLVSDNPRSAGTHLGGAVDWWGLSRALALLAREMGAWATWPRDWDSTPTTPDRDNQHTHAALAGCPHVSDQAAAQLAEARERGDGLLGDNPDPLPAPATWRTYAQGIAWARHEIGKAMTEILAAIAALRKEEADRYAVASGRYAHLVRLLGADQLDEGAVAAALAALIGGALTATVEAAVAAALEVTDPTPAQLAEAVVDALGARLAEDVIA